MRSIYTVHFHYYGTHMRRPHDGVVDGLGLESVDPLCRGEASIGSIRLYHVPHVVV